MMMMTQKQYDKEQAKLGTIRDDLGHGTITPEEAYDALVNDLHYGHNKAVELTDRWGAVAGFVPYSIWNKK